jgi:tetratricopeptide (TPR) repeat protein
LLSLEIGLRLGGLALLQVQEHRNRFALQHKEAYRIMCIGESTTQNQYPSLLEEILNKSNIGIKFSVIDKGLVAADTNLIASQLEENIRRYDPDMVVAMIGINDSGIHMPIGHNHASKIPLTSLKVYKLAQLLLMHMKNRIGREDTIRDKKAEPGIHYLKLGGELEAQGQIESAKQIYKKAIERNPNDIDVHFRLALLSANPAERKEMFKKVFQFYKMLIEAAGINDTPDLNYFLAVFASLDETQIYAVELEGLLKIILARDPRNSDATLNLFYMFLKQRRYGEAEEILKKGIKLHNDTWSTGESRLFDCFAILYHDMGKSALSQDYLRKADELRRQRYSAITINNYKKIKTILDEYRIKLVCVQYPLRSVESLKAIFDRDNNIIFVDNEFAFRNALKKMPYKDLFIDWFAGDFGHCTQKGNRLLAENIANAILSHISTTRGINH